MNLCLTLAESRLADLQRKIDSYQGATPYIEARLDYLTEPGLPRLPVGATQFIATCRPLREGGRFAGGEPERIQVLLSAAASGFHWVDLEHDVEAPALPSHVKVVRSLHRFDNFPSDLPALLEGLGRLPGDLAKLAVAVSSTREATDLLRLMEGLPDSLSRVVIGMGPLGQPSRFLGALLGNHWTYVAEPDDIPVAAGQFDLRQARACLQFGGGSVEIYGVLGRPVGHSLSPALHNGLFRDLGLSKVYFPFELDDLQPWFEYVSRSRLRFAGFSVTIPFKQAAVRFAESVDSPIDSINTLRRTRTGWAASNTDLDGFTKPLGRRFPDPSGKTALVLGCGGVARTVVRALAGQGWEVTVMARNPAKLARFAEELGCGRRPWGGGLRADLLVNTTPVGQYPDTERSPLDEGELNFEVVYDLVYHPRETLLLRQAKRRGAQTISGVEMFLEQAALQFKTWTGREPDRELMGSLLGQALAVTRQEQATVEGIEGRRR